VRKFLGRGVCAGLGFAALASTAAGGAEQPVLKNSKERGVIVIAPTETPSSISTTPAAIKADPVSTRTENAETNPPLQPKVTPQPVPVPTVIKPVVRSCDRPFPNADLSLGSGKGFTSALARKLQSGKRIVVDLAQPYPESAETPSALSPWFAKVKERGGSVTVKQYCYGGRGFGSWLAKIFKPDPNRVYRPAGNYNVLLHSNGLDQQVTQVEFVPKQPAN
jgi:hypothetical protein